GHSSGNTQRLADIAKQSGKPVYQIETEAELDAKALASVKSVGITAGASTPNWIIKRVYRALETLLSKKNQGLSGYVYTLQRILMLTNIYLSVGAGCLCYAWSALQGAKHFFPPMSVSMLYVYSIHIFNNLTGVGADVFNDPDRASFYTRNKAVLEILAGIAVVTGLITSYTIGSVPFVILLFMSIMGLLYNLNFLPKSFISCRYQRIRDIPGSKTVLISIAWGVVTAIIPVFYLQQKSTSVAVLLFVLSICLVFVRTSFFDILDMQGDRIVGKETIAIILGEKRTVHLLKLVLLFIIAALFLASLFHFISSLGFALLICPLFLLMILLAYEHGYLLPSIKLEFYVETNFILLGIITFLWS
ncbi:MAG TPA: 4-hydroxy-3-methylbut-2-enyl diphosphate reductase, partial [Desulfobacteraceae bacterium]|nr:4-hydroxy-3-methylbut-2-enyl diphosphate reductase [Desulfobacteraceae bacterium]